MLEKNYSSLDNFQCERRATETGQRQFDANSGEQAVKS